MHGVVIKIVILNEKINPGAGSLGLNPPLAHHITFTRPMFVWQLIASGI